MRGASTISRRRPGRRTTSLSWTTRARDDTPRILAGRRDGDRGGDAATRTWAAAGASSAGSSTRTSQGYRVAVDARRRHVRRDEALPRASCSPGAARAPRRPSIMASVVRWRDGRLHPMNRPWLRARARADFAEGVGGRARADPRRRRSSRRWSTATRSPSTAGRAGALLRLARRHRVHGPRPARTRTATSRPRASCWHWTPQPYNTLTDARERFYYKARNHLWLLRRGESFGGRERVDIRLARTCAAIRTYLRDSADRAGGAPHHVPRRARRAEAGAAVSEVDGHRGRRAVGSAAARPACADVVEIAGLAELQARLLRVATAGSCGWSTRRPHPSAGDAAGAARARGRAGREPAGRRARRARRGRRSGESRTTIADAVLERESWNVRVPLRHTTVTSLLVERELVAARRRRPTRSASARYAGTEWTARVFARRAGACSCRRAACELAVPGRRLAAARPCAMAGSGSLGARRGAARAPPVTLGRASWSRSAARARARDPAAAGAARAAAATTSSCSTAGAARTRTTRARSPRRSTSAARTSSRSGSRTDAAAPLPRVGRRRVRPGSRAYLAALGRRALRRHEQRDARLLPQAARRPPTCRPGTARRSSGSRSTSAARRSPATERFFDRVRRDVAKLGRARLAEPFSTEIFRRAFRYEGASSRPATRATTCWLAGSAGAARRPCAQSLGCRSDARGPLRADLARLELVRPPARRRRRSADALRRRATRFLLRTASACAGAPSSDELRRSCDRRLRPPGHPRALPRRRRARDRLLVGDVRLRGHGQADALLHLRPRGVPRRDPRLLLRLRGRGARAAARRPPTRSSTRSRTSTRSTAATRRPTTPSSSASARSRTAAPPSASSTRSSTSAAREAPVELGQDPVRNRAPGEPLATCLRRPAAPIRAAVSGSASSSSAEASASGSVGSTTRPVTPSSTISGIAQRSAATHGRPCIIASRKTTPKGS